MNTTQYVTELKKIPKPPKLKEEYREPGFWNEITESLNGMSRTERNNTFNYLRLSCYEEFINEIGYLPSELIMNAVGACAVSLRTISQWDKYDPKKSCVLPAIRKIGEGIASADDLDNVKHNKIGIKAYSTHGFVEGLSNDTTAGDCFLFNVMVYATERAPFRGIPVSSVVEYYFNVGVSLSDSREGDSNFNISNLSLSLDMAVEDIFGEENPIRPRVSATFKRESGDLTTTTPSGSLKLLIVLAVFIGGLFLLFK